MAGFTFGSSFTTNQPPPTIFRKCVLTGADSNSYARGVTPQARIRLDLTTNPLGFPQAVPEMLRSIDLGDFHHYPHPAELPELKQALAEHSGIRADQLTLSAGAAQGIEIVLTHILEPNDKVGILIPTFPLFELIAKQLCDAEIVFFGSLESMPSDCRAIILCTPNNPTTEELELSAIEGAIRSTPDTLFIIDSALSSFGRNNVSSLIGKFENLMVLKSLSKSFGLASFRVGCIESKHEHIEALNEGISPFRVPLICQKAALAALSDKSHIPRTLKFLSREFGRIKTEIGPRAVRNSNVPFFLFMVENPQKAREALLQNHGISVVDSSSFRGVQEGFLRIAIGTSEQNAELIGALAEF